MKKIFLPAVFSLIFLSVSGQDNKTQMLQNLESTNASSQDQGITAKLKNAARLFKDKDDLTSVIMIIPADSIVELLAVDSTFFRVSYEGNEGFIYSDQAVVNSPEKVRKPLPIQEQQAQARVPMTRIEPRQQGPDRYSYLANKYGPSTGSKLYQGKVWRGS